MAKKKEITIKIDRKLHQLLKAEKEETGVPIKHIIRFAVTNRAIKKEA